MGEMYHTWLEHGDYIIDFSTYTLSKKAALMDAADGWRTNVSWSPDFLYVSKSSVSTYPSVRDKCSGLYHYHRNSALERSVLRRSRSFDDINDEIISLLRMQASDLKVALND